MGRNISRNGNINFIRTFFFILEYSYLPHRAGGSQVLLAPPQFLLAPGKWAMLNVMLNCHCTTIYLYQQGGHPSVLAPVNLNLYTST